MSVFHFDFQIGTDAPLDRDEVGLEFRTLEQAKRDAAKGLVELGRDHVSDLVSGEELSVFVRVDGDALCTLVLSMSAK